MHADIRYTLSKMGKKKKEYNVDESTKDIT